MDLSDMGSVGAILILVAIVGLVAGSILWMVRLERARAAETERRLGELGFTAVPPPHDAFIERLARIHRCPVADVQLRSVHRKDVDGGIVYAMDYRRHERDSVAAGTAFVVMVPGLDLPLFSVYPKVPEMALLGGIANRMIQAAHLATGIKPVDLSAFPAVAARYVLTSEEPEALLAALPPTFLQHLASTEWLTVDGAGDMLIVDIYEPGKARGRTDRGQMEQRLRHASLLAGALPVHRP
jgi:hypothetical protein